MISIIGRVLFFIVHSFSENQAYYIMRADESGSS
jgi:hypothetical protein